MSVKRGLILRATAFKIRNLDSPEERSKYTITVVGCGRMGLPTACLFADAGFNVICLDLNQQIVNQINSGISPFLEPGLEKLIKKNIKDGRLVATSDVKQAIPKSDIIVIVVNTPINEKKRPDYSNLESACRDIGLNLRSETLIILESTVGPGVTEGLVKETLELTSGLKAGRDFGLAYSPIRATAGRVLHDIVNYPRILAAIDEQSLAAARAVLKTIIKGDIVEVSNIKTAEATKLFENIYRDVNLALANEFAKFCEKAGIDYIEAQAAANTQPYCHLLKPGIISGHIPKDPYLLIYEAEMLGVKLQLPIIARRVNDETVKRAFWLIKDAFRAMEKTLKRSKIAVLGISYKPNVKEIKGSLIIDLIKLLQSKGINVRVFDPFYSFEELRSMDLPAEKNLTKTLEGSDCLVIAVGHDRFKRLSLKKIGILMRKPSAIVDLAHVVDPYRAERGGFIYRGFGRGVWSK
ncbi:MAG: nucleotide sugar dehydrogenase [Candidatus Bathyarchaeia archaeon]|nr:nucleotide sugar dehydrogenase [Candidatus Bathyarchaeota archaeon]